MAARWTRWWHVRETAGSVCTAILRACCASLDTRGTTDSAELSGEDEPALDPLAAGVLTMERMFCHDAVVSTVQYVEAAYRPCVLLVEYVWMTRILSRCGAGTMSVVDTIDVFSTKADKVLRFGVADTLLTDAEERAYLLRADLVLAIHEAERTSLAHLVPERTVITAGLDIDFGGDYVAPRGERLVIVGSDNQMNCAGLRDFLRFAWPIVRREVPSAELQIVGRLGSELRQPVDGVSAIGWVADLATVYAEARAALNPAVAGTGLKIKTVEALGHYRSLVSWPNGVDGLGPVSRSCCFIATDWFDFAHQTIESLA